MANFKIGCVVALAAILPLAGCATDRSIARANTYTEVDYAQYAAAPVQRFVTFGLQGWEVAGRDKLVIWNGVNEAYLLALGGHCPDLQWAQRIAVTSTTRSVSKFETVRVGDRRCTIDEIRPLDVKRLKANRSSTTVNQTGPRT